MPGTLFPGAFVEFAFLLGSESQTWAREKTESAEVQLCPSGVEEGSATGEGWVMV